MKTPEFFYFDLGAVLLSFDHERMLRQMAAVAGVPADAVRRALMPSGQPERGDPQWRLEAGEISEDEHYEHLCRALGTRPPRAELELAASDIFAPIEGTMRLVERLAAAGRRLGLLSNTNPVHWRFFLGGRYPVLDTAFEIRLGSFQLGGMKPDQEVYRAAVERAGVPAERVFFTDDRQENVAGALACGIDAVRFTDPAGLERALAERGVR